MGEEKLVVSMSIRSLAGVKALSATLVVVQQWRLELPDLYNVQ